ncbi:phosphoribosylaminoimidazolesuccinocarboxamide synthase, partial [Candidatus Bathyarchaeota archaeon]
MGSVKDLEVVKNPMKDEMGIARFRFSDRYSVFDWGEMPDLIEEKGAALCTMSAYCFERLEKKRIKTHYRGFVENGRLVTTDRLKRPCNVMEIGFVNVFHPTPYREAGKLKYNYSVFTPDLTNFLIPLEIMYRNSLPEGSSVF